jgi:EF hand
MNFKKLLVVAVAGAFALPFAAQVSAAGDNLILAQSSSGSGDAGAPPSGASSTGTGPTGGVSPRSAGEPKGPTADRSSPSTGSTTSKRASGGSADFSAIDKNGDGMISRSEWDAYHRAGAASGGATSAPSGAAAAPAARGKTGTTAGPGEASPRTAPSSDTATSGSTSGTGKAQ